MFFFYFIAAYVHRMTNMLTEFGDDILALKSKFIEARKELELEDVDAHRPKIHHARTMPYPGKQRMERCD